MAILIPCPALSRVALIALAACALTACSGVRPLDRPPAPGSFFTTRVLPGDSVSLLAARYQVEEEDLLALNDIKDRNRILAGSSIRVPAYGRVRDERAALPLAPAVTTPRATRLQTRPVAIERRSLAPLPKDASGFARVIAPAKTPAVAETARPSPQSAPAAESNSNWYDWLMEPARRPATMGDNDHPFLWPVEGRLISSFGENPDGGRNDGINIAARRGAPLHAADAGVVSYVGNEIKGYGNLILIRHDNGYVTAYAHADSVLVQRGEHVERGQIIGSAGSTGDVSQPQLHFELRQGTKPVDPTLFLSASNQSSGELFAEGPR